jgi:hypothetical protein
MSMIEATWPARIQVEVKKRTNTFEPLKELLRMLVRGCFHWYKSRPFTSGGMTYRACIDCGARRRFDLDRWEMYGPYFFVTETPADEEHEPRRRATPRAESHARGQRFI